MAPSSSGVADFGEIFREAGMDPSELDRVTKAEDLLRQLPSTIGYAEKRAIVEASLKAFGFEIEKIVGAAQNQRRALDAYVKVNETATAKAITDAEAQIKAFDQKIASLRAEIEKRTAALASLARQAQARKAEVDKVLEFFQGPSSPQR
jgi:chromosome segregation ATPase